MTILDGLHSMQVYKSLLQDPLTVLQNNDIQVNRLPAVNCATARNIWFAAVGTNIVVDMNSELASALAGGEDCAVQRSMIVSPMRGHGLPVGVGPNGRHRPAGIFDATVGVQNLWVTEMQNACTTLVLDWGRSRYSLVHLQPSENVQFNRLSQAIMSMGDIPRSAYKNQWLKRELTTIVGNTVGEPLRYIMVQSMFEASRGTVTQVVGVRNRTEFEFYRQRPAGAGRVVELLEWSTWRSYLPYFSY